MARYDYSALVARSGDENAREKVTFVLLTVSLFLVIGLPDALKAPSWLVWLMPIVWVTGSVVVLLMVSGLREWKIEKFAKANGLQTLTSRDVSLPPAVTLPRGHVKKISNAYQFTLNGGGHCAVYTYEYEVGEGRAAHSYYGSVAQFTVSAQLPNLYLDSHSNKLGAAYQSAQKLQLEGDFNKYFSLYIPDQSQIEALSVITPDVMQALVDHGLPYDIEISGNQVSVCSGGDYYSQESLPHVLAFTSKLKYKLEHRSASWQESLPGAAAAGQLRKKSLTGFAGLVRQLLLIAIASIVSMVLLGMLYAAFQ